ncbi:hypothetical protein C7212DRAFT_363419 [Tuber magnatum]|uniref:Zn(2)-C6 fungal-type domain-containing protein n=1 Tax=Tuber magnatum TaxID=42249 RepID=A0A317SPC4_9PEZI|nr:hypothetical protein C7212DRAFT_363419 [Tuber magnatum]
MLFAEQNRVPDGQAGPSGEILNIYPPCPDLVLFTPNNRSIQISLESTEDSSEIGSLQRGSFSPRFDPISVYVAFVATAPNLPSWVRVEFLDSGQALVSYASGSNPEMQERPPLPPIRHRYHVPGHGQSAHPKSLGYPNTVPNASAVPPQPLADTLNYDHDQWWPEIPEAGFDNSNDGLETSEYGNIWPQLDNPLSSNGFHQLPEIPPAPEGEYFQDFSAEMIQGLEGYGPGLEDFNPEPNITPAKGGKAFPEAPASLLPSIDLPSPGYIPSSSFHRNRAFPASSLTPSTPPKPLRTTHDAPELTISPGPRPNQTFSAGAEAHLGLRHVILASHPEIIYAHRHFIVPARSRKGCWTCRHCTRLGYLCDFTPRYTYKDDSPAKELESITDHSGNPDPHGFLGNDWRPRQGPHVLPTYKFAECVRDVDREILAAQHKPGSFFVVATCQAFESTTRTLNPGIPTCYYTVCLSPLSPPRDIPVSVTIREFLRTDPGAPPNIPGNQLLDGKQPEQC